MELAQRYAEIKKKILNKEYGSLNEMQRSAVFEVGAPLLILAGAGSGKTTVIVNRIAYIIKYGNAYADDTLPHELCEDDIRFLEQYYDGDSDDGFRTRSLLAKSPSKAWNILAITFTNKAANELKERIARIVGSEGEGVWASTFHSCCVKILRRDIERLGYKRSFTIYDTDDSLKVIKQSLAELNLSDKDFPPRKMLNIISKEKDAMRTPDETAAYAGGDYQMQAAAKVYALYQDRLKFSNALDFDDIILLTVRLLDGHEDIRTFYQNKFRYVLVDEYQDTNALQYKLISLFCGPDSNICVVGDDDQSIYKFRGATIENILSFEDTYPNAKIIKLEQNYRSCENILTAANHVIRHNTSRKGKNLWTSNEAGDKVEIGRCYNEEDEARYIVRKIEDMMFRHDYGYNDFAVLYRNNAQSRAIESAIRFSGMPCRIVGGVGFFARKEIKDMLAYMSVVDNQDDALRLRRIISVPRRGIGEKTIETAQIIADSLGISLFEALSRADEFDELKKSASKLKIFTNLIEKLKAKCETMPLNQFYDELTFDTGYSEMLLLENTDESRDRLRNIKELSTAIAKYCESHEDASLNGFLEETALITDMDNEDASGQAVTLMTLHSAKGLEFNVVFMVGMEEGLFPSNQSIFDIGEVEEERRLCYVGITRARRQLFMLYTSQRMIYGRTSPAVPSRFIKELPAEAIEQPMAVKYDLKETSVSKSVSPQMAIGKNKQPAIGRTASAASSNQQYAIGQEVEHGVFGEGVILSYKNMGNDTMLEIEFLRVGIKKIMANYAKLTVKSV